VLEVIANLIIAIEPEVLTILTVTTAVFVETKEPNKIVFAVVGIDSLLYVPVAILYISLIIYFIYNFDFKHFRKRL
jgi:hypothetical protein